MGWFKRLFRRQPAMTSIPIGERLFGQIPLRHWPETPGFRDALMAGPRPVPPKGGSGVKPPPNPPSGGSSGQKAGWPGDTVPIARTCGTCRHLGDAVGAVDVPPHKELTPFGRVAHYCLHPSLHAAACGDDALAVAPYFGCVQWEPRP